MAFEVNQKFIAQIETGEDVLKHIFRVPNSQEWQDYCSLRYQGTEQTFQSGGINLFKVELDEFTRKEMEAADALWEACIENVEGYTLDGQPLSCETKGWRGKIWFPHKVAAVKKLVEFYEAKKEKIEKN